jgi:hypothetical protein
MVGEATPGYMAHPKTPSRIVESGVGDQFIFLLRDPVERAFSQYHYDIQRGVRDPIRSFSEVIRDPNEKIAEPAQNHVGLLEMGKYVDHLKRYEKYFGREQLLPILFGDYVQHRDSTLRWICHFLKVEPLSPTPTEEEKNSTAYPRNLFLFSALKNTWSVLDRRMKPIAELFSPVRDIIRSSLLSSSQERPSMKESDKQHLRAFYESSNTELAEYLDRDLSHWT